MRIAVFSDTHGNPFACQSVIQAIERDSSCDAIIAAGDLCLGGSNPGACIDLLQAAGSLAVYGNTEAYLFAPEQEPNDELHREMWGRIQPVVHWVNSRLTAPQAGWLQSLPFELRFSPTPDPADELLVVHANPRNVDAMIYPSPDLQRSLWDEIRQEDDDPELCNVKETF